MAQLFKKKRRRKSRRPRAVVDGKIQLHHDEIVYQCLDYVAVYHQDVRSIHIPENVYAQCGNAMVDQRIKNAIADYLAGIPDIVLICKGRAFLSDIKTGSGKLSTKQKKWAPLVHHSFDEFKKDFEGWINADE